jgi:hypothetical protein
MKFASIERFEKLLFDWFFSIGWLKNEIFRKLMTGVLNWLNLKLKYPLPHLIIDEKMCDLRNRNNP